MTLAETPEGPVTVSVSWRIRPGQEVDFEAWQSGITAAAHQFPGHLGLNVIRPTNPADPEYVTIFRFDTYAHLKAWEASPVRREWLARSVAFQKTAPQVQQVTGLEFWFTPPGATTLPPPRWKMAAVTALAMYPLINGLGLLWQPLFEGISPWLSTLFTLPFTVLLMTYLVMPWLTCLFARWFQPAPIASRS